MRMVIRQYSMEIIIVLIALAMVLKVILINMTIVANTTSAL